MVGKDHMGPLGGDKNIIIIYNTESVVTSGLITTRPRAADQATQHSVADFLVH